MAAKVSAQEICSLFLLDKTPRLFCVTMWIAILILLQKF